MLTGLSLKHSAQYRQHSRCQELCCAQDR
jgi:hypothetical protein